MKTCAKSKDAVRRFFLQRRQELSPQRRKQASQTIKSKLVNKLNTNTLSYCSFHTELSLLPVNEILLKHGRLFLPKIVGKELSIHRIQSFSQLKKSERGILEPYLCPCCSLQEIKQVFVPGLAFDKEGNRLGYGGGYYDRLLVSSNALHIGVGFKEQLSNTALPIEKHDIRLHSVLLT